MAKSERTWHPDFIRYMEFIVKHKNYQGLPIERKSNGELSWIATAKSTTGQARKNWALKKAAELNLANEPGVYAKVMLEIHPTKRKNCQVCGKEMSLLYVYPNHHMVNALQKDFGYEADMTTHITEIVKELKKSNSESTIKQFFIQKIGLEAQKTNSGLDEVIRLIEQKCRGGHSSMFGPGAMSNFPDRYDGFHTYNRCCRATQDTGRTKENLKTYTKDRRAYEYWSDGNIHAANKYMGSPCFKEASADHMGPISLGFVHDSCYLRPLSKGDNSSKRDRLLFDDIKEIVAVEKNTNSSAMSWYSRLLWEQIKLNYEKKPGKIEQYRIVLKQNMANYMHILWTIKSCCRERGMDFLVQTLLKPKMEYFKWDYSFDELGRPTKRTNRNITDSTRKEFDRFVRIALEAIEDYQEKSNRNVKINLDHEDKQDLIQLCQNINDGKSHQITLKALKDLVENMQKKAIKNLI